MKSLTSFVLLLALTLTPVLGFAKDVDNNKGKEKHDNKSQVCLKAFGQYVKNGWVRTNGQLLIDSNCKIPYGILKKWNYNPATSTDIVSPVINSFIINPSSNKALVNWTANEKVKAVVFYGTTTPNVVKATTTTSGNLLASVYATNGMTITNNAFVKTNGEVTIKNLAPSTTYSAILAVRDASGNVTISTPISFTTSTSSDTTAPTITNILNFLLSTYLGFYHCRHHNVPYTNRCLCYLCLIESVVC